MEKFVIARLFIQPALVQEFQRQIKHLTTLSRQEPGCLEYDWYVDPSEEGAFTVIEHYRDQKDLEYHFSRPELKEFVDKVNAWKSKELQLHFLSAEPDILSAEPEALSAAPDTHKG